MFTWICGELLTVIPQFPTVLDMADPTPSAVMVNGAALREIRMRTGISAAALAEEVGVQRAYITKIELGHSKRVSPEVFGKLLRALLIHDRRALMADPNATLAPAAA